MRPTRLTLFFGSLTALTACHADPPIIDVDDPAPIEEEEQESIPDVEILIDVLLRPASIDVYVTDPTENCACDARFPATGACVTYTDVPTCLCIGDGPIVTASCVTEVALLDKDGTTLRAYPRGSAAWTHVDFERRSSDVPAYDVAGDGVSLRISGCGPDKVVSLPNDVAPVPRVLGTVVDGAGLAPVTHFFLDEHRPLLVYSSEGFEGSVCRTTPSDTVHVNPHNFSAPGHAGRTVEVLDLRGPVEIGSATMRLWTVGEPVSRAAVLTALDDETDAIPDGVLSLAIRNADGETIPVAVGARTVTRTRATGDVTLVAEDLSTAFTNPVLLSATLHIAEDIDTITLVYADGTFSAELLHEPRGEAALDCIENFTILFEEEALTLTDVDDPSRQRETSLSLEYTLWSVLVSTLVVSEPPAAP